MKTDYAKTQKFYFQDNLCDKAIQGCAPAKQGSEPKEEDLSSRKDRMYPG